MNIWKCATLLRTLLHFQMDIWIMCCLPAMHLLTVFPTQTEFLQNLHVFIVIIIIKLRFKWHHHSSCTSALQNLHITGLHTCTDSTDSSSFWVIVFIDANSLPSHNNVRTLALSLPQASCQCYVAACHRWPDAFTAGDFYAHHMLICLYTMLQKPWQELLHANLYAHFTSIILILAQWLSWAWRLCCDCCQRRELYRPYASLCSAHKRS